MKTRIISALFMVPLLLFVFWGGIPLLAICLVFSGIALYEFYKGFKNINIHPSFVLGLISLVCLYMIIIWGEFINGNEDIVYAHLLCLWVFGTVTAGLFVGLFKKGMPIIDGIVTSIGDLYICFFIAHIPLITRIQYYDKLVWLVFIASLGSDLFAYFTGCAIGKHKLCPDISPKKTIEGSIGGIIGAGILSAVFGMFVYKDILIHCVIIGVLGGAFSQCGDLIASMFKRKMGIKDYGNLFPGHGGVLDRFDSTLLIAPFVYYYILVVLRPTGFVSLFYL